MIRPRKSLGQNFLRDPNTVRKIVGSLRASADAPVVEIGPGMGALTGELLSRYALFQAIEVDERAVAWLQVEYPTLRVRQQDVLTVDWAALAAAAGAPLYVIGNLPYYITTPILFSLLSAREHVREVVVMMQLEVAERLVAQPRTKAYGRLSVQVQLLAQPELLFKVSRNVFYPKPAVTSAVVRLTMDSTTETLVGVNADLLHDVVAAAFQQRRKTLRNSLSRWTKEQGVDLPEQWQRSRAEELSPQAFVALTRYLAQHSSETSTT